MKIYELSNSLISNYLIEAKQKCETENIQRIINEKIDDKTFSGLLFRTNLSSWRDSKVQAVHLKSLYKGLCEILDPELRSIPGAINPGVDVEFAKYLYFFDQVTKLLNLNGGVKGSVTVSSMDFFMQAKSSVYSLMPPFITGIYL